MDLYDLDEILNSIPQGEVENIDLNADEIIKETDDYILEQNDNKISNNNLNIIQLNEGSLNEMNNIDLNEMLNINDKGKEKSKIQNFKNSIEFIINRIYKLYGNRIYTIKIRKK